MTIHRHHLNAFVFVFCSLMSAVNAEDAVQLRQQGIDALKRSVNDPDAIIVAGVAFVRAAEILEVAAANEELATEVNSFLFWCKKKMNLQQMERFTREIATGGAERVAKIDVTPTDPNAAKKAYDRADLFARSNPKEHLLIAIRFFEVASRYAGTPLSLEAQQRSLSAQEEALKSTAGSVAKPAAPPSKIEAHPVGEQVPAPDAKSAEAARKTLRELFKTEFAATQPNDKLALAENLAKQAMVSKDDPTSRYVMLREAMGLAVQGGDARLFFTLFDSLKVSFILESTAQKEILTAASSIREQDASKAILALRTLVDKPDDLLAGQLVGKYRALVLEDWQGGLFLLAERGSQQMKDVAAKDLATPKTGDERYALANQWMEIAAKESVAAQKMGAQERALYWYVSADAQLTGLNKVAAQKRIAELSTRPGRRNRRPGLFVTYYSGLEFRQEKLSGTAKSIDFDVGEKALGDSLPKDDFTLRLIGMVKLPSPGEYSFKMYADNNASLWINGEKSLECALNEKTVQVKLTAGDVPILVRYCEKTGVASLRVHWKIPGSGKFEAIPTERLWHDTTRLQEYPDSGVFK